MDNGSTEPTATGAEGKGYLGWGRLSWLLLTLCALPTAAQAEWATTDIEHDWRATLGGNSFGLVQQVTYFTARGFGGDRKTLVCLGPFTIATRVRAPFVAALVILPCGAIGLWALTRFGSQRSGA